MRTHLIRGMRTYLIQRLKKPLPNNKWGKLSSVFSFGGGYKHGGLSDKAFEKISQVISFEYMGSAEFEFGALPLTLNNIVNYIKKRKHNNAIIKIKDNEIFVLCEEGMEDDIEKLIKQLVKNEYKLFLKEFCGLKESLEGKRETVGWLELDNHFMFFIDKEVYNNMMALFGLKKLKENKQ